jgi:thymidylate synthase (FAD)
MSSTPTATESHAPMPPSPERPEHPESPDRLPRGVAPELDRVLGDRFKVLDDGFVRVVDYMGSDESIVQAARVSYGDGTKKIHEDRGLIRYLMRHQHTTPFEMCEIKLHVRVPMDCWRQWIRHRTANINEYSTRYSVAIDSAQTTAPTEWRMQSSENRQGSEAFRDAAAGATLTDAERDLQQRAREVYDARLAAGVAREQARKDLPLSTYTEAYWKVDLHNLFHFLALRLDRHAQAEIRAYSSVIGNEIVKRWCPVAWEAFEEYRLNGLVLSKIERTIVALLCHGDRQGAIQAAEEAGWLGMGSQGLKRNRERLELEAKLSELGLEAPWAQAKGV